MNGAGLFFLLLFLLVILPAAGWIGYTRWRAHQQGLPPPPLSAYIPFKKSSGGSGGGGGSSYPVGPASAGVMGWFQDKFQSIKNRGTGLQGSEAHARGRGSFSQLDPDGAWDDRVGHEADAYGRIGDYEEQELGMHPAQGQGRGRDDPEAYAGGGGGGGGPGAYGGARTAYGNSSNNAHYGADDGERGRSHNRDADTSYHGASAAAAKPPINPFGDDHEVGSLRGVSPRPVPADGDHDSELGHHKSGSGDSASIRTGGRSMFREDM